MQTPLIIIATIIILLGNCNQNFYLSFYNKK